ncbi:MAG: prolyl oligopeptidase family serine peptidase [Nitrospirae bacterium]|nr:prolyl oligopeptidase family serine peptidase [Nitrospirota bacterium]
MHSGKRSGPSAKGGMSMVIHGGIFAVLLSSIAFLLLAACSSDNSPGPKNNVPASIEKDAHSPDLSRVLPPKLIKLKRPAAAPQIKALPLLIHGLADRNVHVENSLDFIRALMAADKPFDFIPVPNMDHSFTGDGLVTALSASAAYFALQIGN